MIRKGYADGIVFSAHVGGGLSNSEDIRGGYFISIDGIQADSFYPGELSLHVIPADTPGMLQNIPSLIIDGSVKVAGTIESDGFVKRSAGKGGES